MSPIRSPDRRSVSSTSTAEDDHDGPFQMLQFCCINLAAIFLDSFPPFSKFDESDLVAFAAGSLLSAYLADG